MCPQCRETVVQLQERNFTLEGIIEMVVSLQCDENTRKSWMLRVDNSLKIRLPTISKRSVSDSMLAVFRPFQYFAAML